jgi:hypothetical protein
MLARNAEKVHGLARPFRKFGSSNLEWVQSEWAHSTDTVEGRNVHRRVDKPAGELPRPAELPAEEKLHARSITLSSNRLGLIAKMDLVEATLDRIIHHADDHVLVINL